MDITTKSKLFEADTLAGMTLKNRIVMAPMTRSRAIGTIPNDLMATYYAQRASAGLIVSEGVSPSPNGLGYARIPGIFNKEQIEGWKKVTNAVHQKDGRIFIQLMHTGRISHSANMPENSEVLAPSAIPAEGVTWTDTLGMQPYPVPQAMSADQIVLAIQEFTQAAQNSMEAGFDGVEIHGANGYLLEQFLNPQVNTRRDEYGGSIENRIRFVVEVVEAVVRAIGRDKVGIRLSPYNTFNSMPLYGEVFDTYKALVEKLNKLGILYIHVIESSAKKTEEGRQVLDTMRDSFDHLWMVNGGYSKEAAEEMINSGRADLISFGSAFISNPDFPKRLQNEIPLATGDPNTFYSMDEKGYTDYPFYN